MGMFDWIRRWLGRSDAGTISTSADAAQKPDPPASTTPSPRAAASVVPEQRPPLAHIHTPLTPVGPLPGQDAAALGWFYSPDGSAVYVNTSLSYIQMLARTGRIGPGTQIWRSGLPGWVAITSVEGIVFGGAPIGSVEGIVFADVAPPAPTPPPPGAKPVVPPTGTKPPSPPAAKPVSPPARSGNLDLEAADFLPITRADIKEQAKDVTRGGAWFGRRDLIPPAEDPRTKLIDRALVTHGLLSPEQLVEIHTVGAEMDRVRPQQAHLETEAFRSGEAAVQADRESRKRRKDEKKAAAAKRKADHAEAVARRKATDIIFLGRGVSRRLNERVSDVAGLAAQGLPLLSTPAELAAALGLAVPRLRWLAFHTDVATRIHYVQFTVPKKSGGLRTLSAPHKTLAAAQRWIFENIVTKLPAEPAAHGFLPGRSILTNAVPHVGQAVVINADLEEFFPTISFRRVRSVFQRLGYSGAVATILALLCTECPRRSARYEGKNYFVATGPRGLPQGACTSPGLSNQVARRLDRRLAGLARRLGLTYTRYADDLTFSGPLPLPIAKPPAEVPPSPAAQKRQGIGYLMARLRHIAEDEGFRIQQTKSRALPQSTAQLVTGVVVNVKPSIRREEIRRLRAILHRARTEGLDAQNRENRENFRGWLEGKIAYVAMIRPDVGAKLKAALGAVR